MYQLKVGCPVYNKARSRLYDRRGMFGVRATVVVAELFASPAFMLAEDPVLAISEYAEYALRPDGPMFYRVPAPQFIEQGQPGYEKPIDFGEGALFIKILKPFVQKMKQSKKDYGRPYGAIGLAFAALEKTFMMYTTGTLVSDDDAFSRDKVGDPVVDYVSNALEFPLRRWDRIMAACGIVPRNAAPSQPVASSSRLNRRDLYIASSP
ncbi:hypothetical protein C8R44DRAFT_805770 [Mycena epipterygia]|nr:hypothetical protein C8R44DRAFT_805770 [Mycena epipterygia]